MGSKRARRASVARRRESPNAGYQEALLRAIRAHLGASDGELSERQLQRLARRFFAAGTAAIQAQRGSVRDSASAMRLHRQMLREARARLAASSRPEQAGILHSGPFQRIQSVLHHHWKRLRDYPNVVGYGAGFRYVEGVKTNERCASILVSKKIPLEQLKRVRATPLPKMLRKDDHAVYVDVVEVGELKLHAAPGDRIAPQSNLVNDATLGLFATDNDTGVSLALTAMHAAGSLQQYPPDTGPASPIDFVLDSNGGQVALGRLLRGTCQGIDAAAIQLDSALQPTRSFPKIGEVTSWRHLDPEADQELPVQMFGARTGQVMHGVVKNTQVYLPGQNLGPAIQVEISAQGGDSGAALLDRDRFVLGLLVSGTTAMQFFSPMGNILHALSCDVF